MRFFGLDSLRAIGALIVAWEHWTPNYFFKPEEFLIGNFFVNLYFVLSGFLITYLLLKDKPHRVSARSFTFFYSKRALRIFPVYYLTVILIILSNGFSTETVSLMTYTFNLLVSYTGSWQYSYIHFWTLAIETQFYLLWPFVIYLLSRKSVIKTLWIMVIIAIISRVTIELSPSIPNTGLRVFTLCNLDFFAIGAWCGLMKYEKRNISSHKNFSYFFLGSLAMTTLFFITQWEALKVFTAILHGVILISFVEKRYRLNLLIGNSRVLNYLGKINYGFYVYHFFIFKINSTLNLIPTWLTSFFHEHPLLYYLFLLLETTLIASFSYHFFEKKFLELKNRLVLKETKLSNN